MCAIVFVPFYMNHSYRPFYLLVAQGSRVRADASHAAESPGY